MKQMMVGLNMTDHYRAWRRTLLRFWEIVKQPDFDANGFPTIYYEGDVFCHTANEQLYVVKSKVWIEKEPETQQEVEMLISTVMANEIKRELDKEILENMKEIIDNEKA